MNETCQILIESAKIGDKYEGMHHHFDPLNLYLFIQLNFFVCIRI